MSHLLRSLIVLSLFYIIGSRCSPKREIRSFLIFPTIENEFTSLDDTCDTSDGQIGICTTMQTCNITNALQALQYNICFFNHLEPIICCQREVIVKEDIMTPERISEMTSSPTTSVLPDILPDQSTDSSPNPIPEVIQEFTSKLTTESTSELKFEPSHPPIQQIAPANRISFKKCLEYMTYSKPIIRVARNVVPARQDFLLKHVVAGGWLTLPSEFPHMAAIGYKETDSASVSWKCGGSLVSEKFILTAAHCATYKGTPPILVRISDQNLQTTNDGAVPLEYKIKNIIKHPEYKGSAYYHDIALIELDGLVFPNRKARPACLWVPSDIDQTKAWITGWGQTEFGGQLSDELLKAEIDITNQADCKEYFGQIRKLEKGILEGQMCAGDPAGIKSACSGDSGGPLQLRTGPMTEYTYHIIGVTSFGRSCAMPDNPGVFTKVSTYLDWIESIVWPE